MALTKYLSFIFLLVAVTSAVSNLERSPGSRKIEYVNCDDDVEGQKDWILVSKESVSAKGKFLQIVERRIRYPLSVDKDCIITCIKVTDLMPDCDRGYPEIQDGGRGFPHVTLRFTSQRSKGFKFEVEIWCKKNIKANYTLN